MSESEDTREHNVSIGDILDTDYGRMRVVDIERGFEGEGYSGEAWLECRLVDEDGELLWDGVSNNE